MTKRLVLATLLVGLARGAAAQPAPDAAPFHVEDTTVAPAASGDFAGHAAASQLDLAQVSGLLKQVAGARSTRPFLNPASFALASARFAALVGPPAPAVRVRVNRKFVPIPLVHWQRYASFITPRGYVAINPSIVIGRRLTWAPELARGGRTIGIAVQMRVWLDGPPRPPATSPSAAKSPASILSTVRTMLDRR